MRNGAFATLANAPVPVSLNRTYRLRLESIGTRHRVFVDGVPLLDVDDASLVSGRAALLTYRTAAEFDNVIASPTPAATLFRADGFSQGGPTVWSFTGPGLWSGIDDGTNSWFGQYSVAGDARAIVGVPTDDQAIDVRARPTTFAGTGGGDRWFGAMARYVDDSNYYYLSVRSSNTASLRKLVNGSITVLATTTLPVTLGTWYSLRVEAVGTKIRGYVNGTLVLEADDAAHARGATGLLTYRAAADFDDYRAIQP
jgi:pectate lyase